MLALRSRRILASILVSFLALVARVPASDQRRQAAPLIAGCPAFPPDNIWNTPVDTLPVHPNSAAWVNTIQTYGKTNHLHPDFGPGISGIPFITVPGSQARARVSFQYADESDPGPYPIPANAPIEGGAGSSGDRHVLVVDRDNCLLYELYAAYPQPDGSWQAGSGAIFNLRSNGLRPEGWTSTDAAGLPVLPGLVRYEEVAAGEIRHAVRFTVPQTQKKYLWPARHYASSLTGDQYPPMGARFRLRADFDVSGFLPENQVILRALKKYGIILSDNGSSWFITGAPDDRWDNTRLSELKKVLGSSFEAVDVSSLMVDRNSGQVRAAVVNAATFQPGPVAPGEIISIFGSGLGPAVGMAVSVNAPGFMPTAVAETRALFDGVGAPLLFVRADQVNAVVPYSVAGKAVTQLQMEYKAAQSPAVPLAVAQSAPGIFTMQASGQGQGAVFHPDWSANSAANPAGRGSVVVMYATGGGESEPAGIDGAIADASPVRPKLPIAVTIGGLPASVLYAGPAPGFVSGLMQINVRVPDTTSPGPSVPVVLSVGTSSSQQGVTLAVR